MPGGREVRAGKAFVEISLRDRVGQGLKRIAKRLRAFGSMVGTIGSRIVGIGTAFAAPFIPAIKAASDMQETMSKFNTVFGDNANAVKQWADQFAADVGRSKQQIASFLAGSQDLFVPLGFDAGTAEDLSKQITGLALDLASFNNLADADALLDLHAALTGSGEVMKKYGVIVSEAAVKQELLNQGLDPKKATQQQKVMARLAIIMRGTTAAQGDAVRTADSFANQMKRLRGSLSDVAVEVGNAILPTVTSLVRRAGNVVRVVGSWLSQNRELVATFAAIVAGVVGVGSVLVGIGASIAALGFAFSGLATAWGVMMAAVGGLGTLLTGLLSPIGLIAVAVAGAVFAWARFSDVGKQVVSGITVALGELWAISRQVFGGIAQALAAGDIQLAANILWRGLKAIWLSGLQQLNNVWSMLTQAAGEAWSVIQRHAGVAIEWIASVLSKLPGFVTGPLGAIGTAVSKVLAWIGQSFDGLRQWAGETFSAIANALAEGDFSLAAEVAWTSIKLAFASGIAWVTNAWTEFTTGLAMIFDGVVTSIRQVWNNISTWIARQLLNLVGIIQQAVAKLAEIDPTGLSEKLKAAIDFDVDGAIRILEQDRQRFNQGIDSVRGDRDSERAARMRKQLAATERRLADLRAARQRALDRGGRSPEPSDSESDPLATAMSELQQALDEAASRGSQLFDAEQANTRLATATGGLDAIAKQSDTERKFTSQGTFSAAATFGLAAGGVNDRATRASEQTAENTKRLVEQGKRKPKFR